MKIQKNNLGVSEITGTILILAITVPFITSVYIATMALPPPSETPIVDIVGMTIEGENNIVFSNQGGDELPIETIVIFDIGGNQITKTVEELIGKEAAKDGYWNIGEEITFNYDFRGFHVESKIVDPYTNSVVWWGLLQEGDYMRDPYVLTENVSNIQASSATLSLRYNFWNESGTVNFAYREIGQSWIYTPSVAKSGESTYDYTINGLVDDTVYEYKAQLTWDANLTEGDVKIFTTITPFIITLDATDVRTTEAKLWLQYDFKELSGAVSFSYRKFGDSWIDTPWYNLSGQGTYSENIENLIATTNYEFKARMMYDSTLKEGEIRSFITWSIIMGLWHFSEGTGTTAYDSSGLNNHATIFDSEWTTGVNTTGLSFDGVNDYLRVYDSASLDISEDLTVETWVKPLENNKGYIGEISNSVIDTSWFGPNYGLDTDIIHISGGVYCVAFRGDGDDGYLATFSITDNGMIKNIISYYEFETNYCYEPDLINIAPDIYAIAYEGPGNDGFIKTVMIDQFGQIKTPAIDTLEFDTINGRYPDIIHVFGSTYAIAYVGPDDDGYIVTISIDISGNIQDTTLEKSIFCDTEAGFSVSEPRIIIVSKNVYAIVFRNPDDDGEVRTLSIQDAGGLISAARSDGFYIDKFIFDVYDGWRPNAAVTHINSDIYAVTYRGREGKGFLATINIDPSGNIMDDPIDKMIFDSNVCFEPELLYYTGDFYTIVYRGTDNDGYIVVLEINGTGEISDTVIDMFEFDTRDCYKPVINYFKNDILIIAYTHYNEGYLKTVRVIPKTEISEIQTSRYCIFDFTEPNIINVYNDIYAIVNQGLDGDGYLRTVQISNTGDVSNNIIDVLEFDLLNGRDPIISRLSGNYFAITYCGSGDDGFIKTLQIANDGDIVGDNNIDTLEFNTQSCYEPDLIHINGNIYAIAYRGPSNFGYVTTVEIINDQITDVVIDNFEFESSYCFEPDIIHISGNIYGIVYRGPGDDGFYKSLTIMNNGDIIDAVVDFYEFDTSTCFNPKIINVNQTVYVVVYSRNNVGGFLATFEIQDSGLINKILLDSLRFDTRISGDDDCYKPQIYHIGEWVYAIVYRGEYNGYIVTLRIGDYGDISDVNDDYLLFDAYGYEPQIIHLDGDYYAIPYRNWGTNAAIKTVEIRVIEATWPRPIVYKYNAYGLQANSTTIFGYINGNTVSAPLVSDFNYVVLTYNRSLSTKQMKLYINGVLQSEYDYSGNININGNNLIIGNDYNCIIDEVTIWNIPLTDSEILTNYNLLKP